MRWPWHRAPGLLYLKLRDGHAAEVVLPCHHVPTYARLRVWDPARPNDTNRVLFRRECCSVPEAMSALLAALVEQLRREPGFG